MEKNALDLDFWFDRYKKLLFILEKLQSKAKEKNPSHAADWSIHKGTEISLNDLDQKLPNDFKAFISTFGSDSQIGTRGMVLLGVDVPQNHKNSEVFKNFYSDDIWDDIEDEEFVGKLKLKEIHWFGYTASAFDVIDEPPICNVVAFTSPLAP